MSMKHMDQRYLALLHACAAIFDQFPEQSSKTLVIKSENGESSSCPVFVGKMTLERLLAAEAKLEAEEQARKDAPPPTPPQPPRPPMPTMPARPQREKPVKVEKPTPTIDSALPLRERVLLTLLNAPGKPRLLAAELDVSIDDVNNLLETLAAEGVVRHEQGAGWTLTERSAAA